MAAPAKFLFDTDFAAPDRSRIAKLRHSTAPTAPMANPQSASCTANPPSSVDCRLPFVTRNDAIAITSESAAHASSSLA